MKPRLLTFVSVLSLLLCAAVIVSWVRSYLPEQFHVRSHRGRVLLVFSAKQYAVLFDEEQRSFPIDNLVPEVHASIDRDPNGARFAFAGFEVALSDRQTGFWLFAVPHWALAVPLGAVAACGVWARRRRHSRAAAGRCLRCGYDLRASGGRCPECGMVATGSDSR